MKPDNGEDADIWVQNNSTDTIYAKLTVGNLSPIDIPIEKETQETTRLAVIGTTKVKLYIYSSTGQKIDMSISARQFNINISAGDTIRSKLLAI